jgi:hypothetical protein
LHTYRYGFLTDVQVAKSSEFALRVGAVRLFFKAPVKKHFLVGVYEE